MLSPLFLISLAAVPAPTTTQVDDSAAEQCRMTFEQRLGLKIGSIQVAAANHANGWTVLRGRFSGYRSPAPAAPGMMAPLHVVSENYRYVCSTRNGFVRRSSAKKISP